MHVAIVFDDERLEHEHNALNRLCIALMNEGAQLTRIIPDSLPTDDVEEREKRIGLAARLRAPMRVALWSRRARAARLVDMFDKPPDVLHAIGEYAWPVAIDLGAMLSRPVTLDVWSAELVRRAPRGRSAAVVGAYTAPTAPIAAALRRRVGENLVTVVPPGVAVPGEAHEALHQPASAIAMAIVGSGRDVPAYRAVLAGLARIVREHPQIQAFLELRGLHDHEIWRYAQQLDLLSHLSAITDASLHRALLTRCDVMIVPERLGEIRLLPLEAMAAGVPVIASADECHDLLIDGRTAMLVTRNDPDTWAEAIGRIPAEPKAMRSLGASARAFISEHHRSGDQGSRLLRVLEQVVSGGAYPFPVPEAVDEA